MALTASVPEMVGVNTVTSTISSETGHALLLILHLKTYEPVVSPDTVVLETGLDLQN